MITLNVDKSEVIALVREQVRELAQEVDLEFVYWDTNELKRRTCMSWNTIQDTFFFDHRFPKKKVGGKWYFPVRATRTFLEKWLEEQPS